ncbi:hypothetical protein VNO78_10772 [Psophocarpus tetragonolobus]|uniref:Uncharacterized protein n=1 Tax=Psophocarpus tetragonolobus TaxID=3891 RepID=A0AAN9SLW0_PSOTE
MPNTNSEKGPSPSWRNGTGPTALIPVLVEPCDVGPVVHRRRQRQESPSRKNCNKAGSWATTISILLLLSFTPLTTDH